MKKDVYTIIKGVVPRRFRLLLKPIYLKWSLRNLRQVQSVTIRKYGFRILVDSTNGAVDQYVFMHRNWETKIASIIENEMKAGQVFVDVGANIGYFSLLASKLVGSKGRIISFEPLSKIAKQLSNSVELNGVNNVCVKQMALGQTKDKLTMTLIPGNMGGSSLVKEGDAGIYEAVEVSTLDEELSEESRVDLIKIDVEGYENEVLLGAKKTLIKYKPKLILELSPRVYSKRDPKITRSILSLLTDLGYVIHDIDNDWDVTDIDLYLNRLGSEQTNLFAVIR